MKLDEAGFLDVKLAVVVRHVDPWVAAFAELGAADVDEETAGWRHLRVPTTAQLKGNTIRVHAYIGPPSADVTVGFVGADRILTDNTVEVPDVSLAAVPQHVAPAGKDAIMAALKAVLKDAKS
jgi:hypothetical protein